MYNLAVTDNQDRCSEIAELFGEKYDITDDLSQTNVLVICSSEGSAVPDSKLLFAVCDMTEEGLPEEAVSYCAERGIAVFRCDDIRQTVSEVRSFIENGDLTGNTGFPEIDLGPFGNDLCRIIIMTKGIDDPILLTAMMFSGMDVRAIAGGLNGDYGCALIALREPIARIPHVDGILKVRVLQDI